MTHKNNPEQERCETIVHALQSDWPDATSTSSAEIERYEQHVVNCETCRQMLDESTVDSAWWNDAKSFLATDQWDQVAETPSLSSSVSSFVSSSLTPVLIDESGSTIQRVPETEQTAEEKKSRARQIVGLLDPTDDPKMLGRFGGYEIVGVIGQGGMGIVLKGFESSLNRFVAIKVLSPHLASSGAARQRFSREAQAAAAVLHENVIAIHRVAEANGLPFLVMPYVAGPSLQKRLDADGQLPTLAVLRIGQQVAAGLAAAHSLGLVHRDIKPANILLERGVERVTITDFGLARAADDASLTHTGMIAGTPQYMSPEQARGEAIDARSDLFSLGSMLYTCVTGRPPFRGETSYGILMRTANERPRPIRELNPETPTWLVNMIERLHEKETSNRFPTAGQVADLLGECIAHVQQPVLHQLPQELSRAAVEPGHKKRLTGKANEIDTRKGHLRLVWWSSFAVAILVLAIGWFVRTQLQTDAHQYRQSLSETIEPDELSTPLPQPTVAQSITSNVGDSDFVRADRETDVSQWNHVERSLSELDQDLNSFLQRIAQ